MSQVYLKLQESEATVVLAAAQIYSAYLAKGDVHDNNRDEIIGESIKAAVKIATTADKYIDSDDESRSR